MLGTLWAAEHRRNGFLWASGSLLGLGSGARSPAPVVVGAAPLEAVRSSSSTTDAI